MTEKITSLCYVSKRDDRSTQLCRIADYSNGAFHPYTFAPGSGFSGTDRDILYFPSRTDAVNIGDIGVYEWSVDTVNDKDWTYVSKSSIGWVEVVETSMETPEMIVQLFLRGWSVSENFSGQHDVIVCCASHDEKPLCVYVHREDFQKAKQGYTLAGSVEKLQVGRINPKQSSEFCTCRYSPRDNRRYLVKKDFFEPQEQISVRGELDHVSAIIQAEMRSLSQGMLSRREKQLISAALEKLNTNSLKETVMARLNCDEAKADRLIKGYLKHVEGRIDDKDVLAVFDALVENDSSLVERLKNQVAVIFERENEKKRQEAQTRLNEIQESIRAAENSLTNIREREKETRRRIEQAKQTVAEKEKLVEEIDAEIQRRIQEFQEHPASGLVDRYLGQAAGGPAAAPKTYSIRRPAPMDAPVKIEDAFEQISKPWNGIVSSSRATEFALLSMAAYVCRQELLLAGNSSSVFADAIARTITGRDAVHVNLSSPIPDLEAFLKEMQNLPCPVVCFEDALGAGYESVRSAASRLKDILVLYTVRHPEALVMEPQSLYISCFPILTDPLCLSDRMEGSSGANCTEALENLISQLTGQGKHPAAERWFGQGTFSPLQTQKCKWLETALCLLSEKTRQNRNYGSRILELRILHQLFRSMGRADAALELLLTSSNLTAREKEDLRTAAANAGDEET